ncbi:MAG: glycosyltransferase family 2 protein [Novosphingobium sp.]|nr:glycosyltransferase family 2 protein [Novosphingobium sp.]
MPDKSLITLVIPYFNEADFIGATLSSISAQTDRRFRLILVDNGSDDGSERIARTVCDTMPDIDATFLRESLPGKINALITGTASIETPYFSTLDADTIYPSNYVELALGLFDRNPDASCVLAFGLGSQKRSRFQRAKLHIFSLLLPRKCHTGGYAQVFRSTAFKSAGGFDVSRWPYVLEDHEIVFRLLERGPLIYNPGFVCFPSDRRQDRSDCSWNLAERVIYKLIPSAGLDWFFYRFLGPRLDRRGLNNLRLRDRAWQAKQAEVQTQSGR